uniref:Uncharacterized protein n=1 Tax=viral metagenome TaxID=1070528 RepID=A0A6M3KMX4_9ZZZZ
MRKRERISLAKKLLKEVEEEGNCISVCPARLFIRPNFSLRQKNEIYHKTRDEFCHFLFPDLAEEKINRCGSCGPCPCHRTFFLSLSKKQVMDRVKKLAEEE